MAAFRASSEKIELPDYQIVTESVGRQVFRLITVRSRSGARGFGRRHDCSGGRRVDSPVLFRGRAVALAHRFPAGDTGVSAGAPRVLQFLAATHAWRRRNAVSEQVDVLMVGFLLSESAVGIYSLSTVLVQVLRLPLIGFNMMFPPIAVWMYGNDELADLEALFTRVTRWWFTLSLLPSLGLLIYSTEVYRSLDKVSPRGARCSRCSL